MRHSTHETELDPLVARNRWKPQNAVWEITLACNLRCRHCGSRAGKPLPDELTTEECLRVVDQLADEGCEVITLSGGEPTLREDWEEVARAVARRGVLVNMVTNGVYQGGLDASTVARRALASGMCNVGVSLDGPEPVHNEIRGAGRFRATADTIRAFCAEGLKTTIITTLNQLNIDCLDEIHAIAMDLGANALRFQLAKPMGVMGEHQSLTLRPEQIFPLMPKLARLKVKGGIDIRVGDSLGYYGQPDRVLRGWGWRKRKERWGGCQAGMQAVGIQANGDVKGCLSIQAMRDGDDPFVEGNLREHSLSEIWHRKGAFAYNRAFRLESLKGACQSCDKATLCRGGAVCVATAVGGAVGEDLYCYYRFTPEYERADWAAVGRTAAAAALVLTVGAAGACSSDSEGGGSLGDAGADASADTATGSDTSTGFDTALLDYAVEPVYGVAPDYAVTPEDTETSAMLDYAVTPDYAVEIPDVESIKRK